MSANSRGFLAWNIYITKLTYVIFQDVPFAQAPRQNTLNRMAVQPLLRTSLQELIIYKLCPPFILPYIIREPQALRFFYPGLQR